MKSRAGSGDNRTRTFLKLTELPGHQWNDGILSEFWHRLEIGLPGEGHRCTGGRGRHAVNCSVRRTSWSIWRCRGNTNSRKIHVWWVGGLGIGEQILSWALFPLCLMQNELPIWSVYLIKWGLKLDAGEMHFRGRELYLWLLSHSSSQDWPGSSSLGWAGPSQSGHKVEITTLPSLFITLLFPNISGSNETHLQEWVEEGNALNKCMFELSLYK